MAQRLLLDTHALVWALTEPDRLSARARALLADRGNELLASAASAWEIATKQRIGKLAQADPLVAGYDEHVARLGAVELPISARHALVAGALTWAHRDPFDRMLATQSVLESVPLVSRDDAFDDCAGVRRIW